ncbi:MAG: sigma-70 family RNA polymerase sigma factor [Planctomycetes bacterium]|nr:sigma-70 family RNA polymerase sigma factor [Planctomycetota bacterium]
MALDVEALIVAQQAGVWRYLRYLGCDRAQADDITQETFLQVLRHGFDQRGERETAAYLRTVARNCFLMNVRKTRHVQSVEDLDLADNAWEQGQGDAEAGEARLRALRQCLESIHGKARQALEMQYMQQRSGEDIAAAMSMSHENVRVMLHRAKQALKKCIEGKLGQP